MKDLHVPVGADDNDPQPLCPHCSEELVYAKDPRSHLRRLYNLHVFSCPHCRKVLGVTTVIK